MKKPDVWKTLLLVSAFIVATSCGEKVDNRTDNKPTVQFEAKEKKNPPSESKEKELAEAGNGSAKPAKPKVIIPQVIPPEPRPPYLPAPEPYDPYVYDPNPGPPPVSEPIKAVDEPLLFADPMPEFPGGADALQKFMVNNIRYPQVCLETDVQGKVYVRFVVNTDGSIEKVEVLRGIPDCRELDKEAVRFVKSMPKWKPGIVNGKPVKVYMTLPIRFHVE
jgi:TonB family protein